MSIEESITLFNDSYPALTKEKDELIKQITSIFEKKLDEIRPIINLMKEKDLYFFHPDLKNLSTTHGVILGRNRNNNSEIYVFNGNHFLQKVDAHNDKVLDSASIPIRNFFRLCDLDFAINGIDHVRNYLPTLLVTLENQNTEKRTFVEKYNN